MIDLTEMAELVDRSGPDGYTVLVATASKDGAPDLAFKGSVMVWDKDHLAFWERAHGVTLSNLEENPRAALVYRNRDAGKNWRFWGDAQLLRDGELRERDHGPNVSGRAGPRPGAQGRRRADPREQGGRVDHPAARRVGRPAPRPGCIFPASILGGRPLRVMRGRPPIPACKSVAKEQRSMSDPTVTDPDKYKVVFENDRVRVLEYRDEPGQRTSPHQHPDSVMHTLSSFKRRLIGAGGETVDVTLPRGMTRWLGRPDP